MKAIVLTCDKYISITDHMLYTYQRLWSSNPFKFRIPYQTYPQFIKDKYGNKVELIETEKSIKSTALKLLEDIPDNEWIYWCMDDKYLIQIEEKKVNQIYQFVKTIKDTSICGIAFCRFRKWLQDDYLKQDSKLLGPNGQIFLERVDYSQIWIHQFVRAKVFRDLFESFPERPFNAREMDKFKDEYKLIPDKKLYVNMENLVVLGESTLKGKITTNCLESYQRWGIKAPEHFEINKHRIIMGKLPRYYSLMGLKFSLPKYLTRSYWLNKFSVALKLKN